jgi:biopolymer transport protein ExbB/TolQ
MEEIKCEDRIVDSVMFWVIIVLSVLLVLSILTIRDQSKIIAFVTNEKTEATQLFLQEKDISKQLQKDLDEQKWQWDRSKETKAMEKELKKKKLIRR